MTEPHLPKQYAWTICAQVLIRHLGNLRRQFKDETQVNHELDCMVVAMENLRISYPVVGELPVHRGSERVFIDYVR